MTLDPSTFKVDSLEFSKEIEVPSSKSYANRVLVLAALAPQEVIIENLPLSTDVLTMIDCLKQIGLQIEESDRGLVVKNSFPACELKANTILKTKDGGTTNRFLIPLLARGKRQYQIEPEGHMRERPMEALLDAISELGVFVEFKKRDSWLKIKGPINEEVKSVEIDCSQTTQFLTGLSLALSNTNIQVIPKNLSVSLPYWELTKSLIDLFQKPIAKFFNPVDFSSLSYPLALAAVTGDCLVTNCHEQDKNQADSKFIELLSSMGARLDWKENGLLCKRETLKAIDFDGSQCPDVIPTLLYVCAFAEGTSTITNLEVLTHKECDRFVEMIKMLDVFGVKHKVDYKNYSIKITGPTSFTSDMFYLPPADHRMVMVAYLFLRTLGGGEILGNTEHVRKSFANFYEVMG